MDTQILQTLLVPVLQRHPFVLRAALFGSHARGEARKDSDVDLLVEYQEGTSLLDVAGLGLDLEEAAGTRVELVTPSTLSDDALARILAEKKDIYARTPRPAGRYSRVLRDHSRLYERPVQG
jgi:hypothetical protein